MLKFSIFIGNITKQSFLNIEVSKILNNRDEKKFFLDDSLNLFKTPLKYEELYSNSLIRKGKEYTQKYVAKANQSEHQTGLAIDITNSSRCFDKNSKEAKWLADNAYKYGFILRYLEGKTDITGYNYEPWHIRYVGKKVAKEIYNNSETLEEYLERLG